MLSAVEPGVFSTSDVGQAIGTVGSDLDLGRPAAQQSNDRITGEGGQDTSLELLGQYDADDVVLVLDFSGDGGDASPARELVAEPVWQQLEAARRGQLHSSTARRPSGGVGADGRFLDVLEDKLLADRVISTGVNG